MDTELDTDIVTGATVDVMTEVDLTPERVWALVTAVDRIGEWSPECVGAQWLTDGRVPRVGARFEGLNRFGGVFESTSICVVIEADRPRSFAWAVLDDRLDIDTPGSLWRYDIARAAGAGRTFVRHEFVHGPGLTGVREPAERDPARAAEIMTARLDELGRNMERTIGAMTGATTFSTVSRLGGSVGAEVTR
jgi:uncharacterized protein YndB with AHSA1/START domain